MRFAASSAATDDLRDWFLEDDWFTDGDSNVYNLPTFLGNHDRGRVGMFLRNANPGASEAELLARDRLAHALMYFSRGNPVVYYGDEQGFTGAGGDQDSRQDMFPSQSPQYNNLSDPIPGDDGAGKNDDIGSDETPMDDNFDPAHPLYQELARLARVTRRHPTLRERRPAAPVLVGRRRASTRFRGSSFTARVRRRAQQRRARRVGVGPDLHGARRVGAALRRRPRSAAHRQRPAARTSPSGRSRRSCTAPRSGSRAAIRRRRLAGRAGRPAATGSRCAPTSPATRSTRSPSSPNVGNGPWQDIGTDDNAPYRVFHDVSDVAPGTTVQLPRDRARQRAATRARAACAAAGVAPPAITLEAPNEGQRVRGTWRFGRPPCPSTRTTSCASSARWTAARSRRRHRRLLARLHRFDDTTASPTARGSRTARSSPTSPGRTSRARRARSRSSRRG